MFVYSVLKSAHFATKAKRVMNRTLQHHQDYESCIEVLNSLQSNAQYIKLKSQVGGSSRRDNRNQLKEMEMYLNRTGLSLDKLDELSVIHVAGTKGKGTTCAISERILRQHGYKTGFFSSPHLFEVRERIRINGKPILKDEFAAYFTKIHSLLDQEKRHETDMPLYFRFLTVMAFAIFLDKKVDVAIIEVGIGGEFDCTNVLRKVPVVGITSLGIDHTSLLGSTIESIAWNKGGIMKEGCRAFTVPQPEKAMTILKQRSIEKKCKLEIVNNLNFNISCNSSYPANIFNLNASLAIALCQAWLSHKHNKDLMLKEVTEKALSEYVWPGRYQIIYDKNITFYLDGAHTLESITICSEWFKGATNHSKKRKALMFNVTGGRNAEALLKQLRKCQFDTVLFVTNEVHKKDISTEALEKCEFHKALWLKLEQIDNFGKSEICQKFSTVMEAIVFLSNQDKYNLLVSGSIHLVGAVLSIVDPNLNDNCL